MNSKTERQKMINGEHYDPSDKQLEADRINCRRLMRLFNDSREDELSKRTEILKELFGQTGAKIYMEPRIKLDYGYNIKIGDNFYSNFDITLLDVCPLTIGNNVYVGPSVSIYTATHPLDSKLRTSGIEFGKPVVIKDNVWLCGGCIINPGVTIGNNVVVSSGAVVTKSVRDNVLVAGNPAVIVKEIQ
eukprot:NODE_18_length_47517_cov_0.674814.p21 type:complete len:188 gc:universal NODE_18_length_47517_cov_0.674814:1948-1385(-)